MREETTGMSDKYKYQENLIRGQLELLAAWNKQKINVEPEQARKNLETIMDALRYLYR